VEIAPDGGALLSQQGEAEFKPGSSALGSGGIVTLRFKAIQPGTMKLKLIYHRTFEPSVPPLQSYEIGLVVESSPIFRSDDWNRCYRADCLAWLREILEVQAPPYLYC